MTHGLEAIYTPRGRAGEYSELALEIYEGCSFSCRYCFNVLNLGHNPERFYGAPVPRKDILARVERDCKKLSPEARSKRVLLCFSCDPYQDLDLKLELTRKVLVLFKESGVGFQILTKGGRRAERDFDLYKPGDALATTLTFVDPDAGRLWEPNAAPPAERFQTLKNAHQMGIMTWVSLEPVICPEQTLAIIKMTHPFVNHYKVGTLNYHDQAENIDWRSFGRKAVTLLNKLGKDYYVKKDLARYLGQD